MDQDRPIKILIVEDEFLITLHLIYILESWSSLPLIITATDGEDGLLKTREHQPDLIITDLAMPRLDGCDMAKLIRQEKKGRAVPIIGISASDPADVRLGTFQALCDDFIDKPFSQRQVIEKINFLLHRSGVIS